MIAIVETKDITGIDLDTDWTILEYDTGSVDSSGLASIEYTTVEPEFALHLFTQEEYELFKQSSVWRLE